MQASQWRHLSDADLRALSAARLEAHYAVQWLARAARAYIPPAADDSHTSLGWNGELNGFETSRFPDGSRLGFGVADRSLIYLSMDRAPASFTLGGRTNGQAGQWVADQMSALGYDTNALDAKSPYAMPPHPVAAGAAYATAEADPSAAQLAAWFANAEIALRGAVKHFTAAGLTAPAPRCWPHHFDFATLTSFPAKAMGETAYVGAGFSPGDPYYDEPYFYVSLYPAPDKDRLPPLASLGHWRTHEFTAAIATAGALNAARDPRAAVDEYLKEATDIAVATLRAPARAESDR
jgi:hypothetical protein